MFLLECDSVLLLMLPYVGPNPVQEERMSAAVWLCWEGGESPLSSPQIFLPFSLLG